MTLSRLLQTTKRVIKTFPEVESVYGKAGRAASATDPAPIEMFETVINLKPEKEWRAGINVDKLIAEMDAALKFPGLANSWTMPIKARIDMLSTGIRTSVGVKVFGGDRESGPRDRAGGEGGAGQFERLRRAGHGRLLPDITPKREQLARYGITVGDFQQVISSALGGALAV